MNNATNEKINKLPRNEAANFLELMYCHGIVSLIHKPDNCKMHIVKLGLTVPRPNKDRLLFSMDGPDIAYFFSCTRDRKSHTPRWCFTGFVFDIAMYRSHPLPGVPDVRQALRIFAFAVAQLEGLDPATCTLEQQRPVLN